MTPHGSRARSTMRGERTRPTTMPRLERTPEALVFRGVGDGFEHVAVPGVQLGAGDLLARVELATVCGSDRHTAAGHRDEATPLVLGHEQVGRIVAVGPGEAPRSVDDLPLGVGDRIVWGVAVACKACDRCRRGLTNKCLHLRKYGHTRIDRGWELNGGFATHVHVVAGSDIVRVPDDVPAEVLAPASCATATVVAAIEAAGRPLRGEIVVVSGCGMLGLTTIAIAHAAGAIVVGIDPDPQRRRQARAFGAAVVCAPGAPALREAIEHAAAPKRRLSRTTGFAAAFEMSGSNGAVTSLLATADVGASIVLVGHVFPSPPLAIDPEHLVRNVLTITGVHNYRGEHLLRAVEFLRGADHDRFASLVGDIVSLSDAASALAAAPAHGARTGIRP